MVDGHSNIQIFKRHIHGVSKTHGFQQYIPLSVHINKFNTATLRSELKRGINLPIFS